MVFDPLIRFDAAVLRRFQAASDALSPWIGCYRLARYLFASAVAPALMTEDGVRHVVDAMGWGGFCLSVIAQAAMTHLDLQRLDRSFNTTPYAASNVGWRMLLIAISLGMVVLWEGARDRAGICVIMVDLLWLLGAYFEACVQIHPPAKPAPKNVNAYP
jgi:hypothetical protein